MNAWLGSSALVLAGLSRGGQVSGTPSEEAYDKPAGQGPVCKQHSAG